MGRGPAARVDHDPSAARCRRRQGRGTAPCGTRDVASPISRCVPRRSPDPSPRRARARRRPGLRRIAHSSATARRPVLWGLASAPADDVDVTVVARGCRSRDGLRVHRVESLSREDRAERRGIPVTAPARTLIDFASTTGAEEAERAIAEAFALRLVTESQIRAALDRAPGRAGVARVQTILGQPGGPKRTRSGGERAMLRLVRAAHLPAPRTNYPVAGYSADFCWPDQRVIVEIDGYDFHSGRRRVRARSSPGHRPQERRLRGAPVHRAPARRGAVARDHHHRPGA